MTVLFFLAGLTFLIAGAEALVRGASRMAAVLGISPLVIGLTVVAFGTSSPELAVSIKSALSGEPNLAVGNVVGSNIFNVLFILGLSALITPLVVSKQLVRSDVPVMVVLSFVVLVLSLNGSFSRTEGFLLIGGLIVYFWYLFYQSQEESVKSKNNLQTEGDKKSIGFWAKNAGLFLGGIALLIIGSRWLVDSAVIVADYLGVSELVVGLTILAAGTSLPEVVTSVIAALRGEREIAVGNVVGSNIFNIMGVLGITSIAAPAGIEVSSALTGFDIPVMVVAAFACLPIFFTGGMISRQEGVLLLGYYIAYTLYLILAASHHDALAGFNIVMMYFVIPITIATISIVVLREISARK
ncbi:MAG: calcium/sodium antiporter [Balneolales bacterium]